MGSVEHRREESNPLDTVLETVPLPKLADKELLSGIPKEKPPGSVSRWAAPWHHACYRVMMGSPRRPELAGQTATNVAKSKATDIRRWTRRPNADAAPFARACSSWLLLGLVG
ncbi:hypothetical protein GCM10027598_07270 [Amycolatopsis oliviviridis]|uniref:Uncharacterized protein n=1 Tax=Amycolatopsis oliviviridis TaxID=1471590 RepID=A0ABQ3LMM1_9PSEU|nr:hypothetical protein GCM10017790_40670 [Amycolatopsis oliviviridis]